MTPELNDLTVEILTDLRAEAAEEGNDLRVETFDTWIDIIKREGDKMADSKPWTMPEWMEPYRGLIRNTGGNSVEDLVNDTSSNTFNNPIRAALCVAVESQVSLLIILKEKGHLGTIDEFQTEIGMWGDTTFPSVTIDTIAAHFQEEVEEFLNEHANGTDDRARELADVFLLMLHYAHRAGFSLSEAAAQKMAINKTRVWNTTPEPAGHWKHANEGHPK